MNALQRSSRSGLKQANRSQRHSTQESASPSTQGRLAKSASQPLDKRKTSESSLSRSPTSGVAHSMKGQARAASHSVGKQSEADDTQFEDAAESPSALTNSTSSSLSELVEEMDGVTNSADDHGSDSEEMDTEAETERLDPSPQKVRRQRTSPSRSPLAVPNGAVSDEDDESDSGPIDGHGALKKQPSAISQSSSDLAGRKRKRTASANLHGNDDVSQNEQTRKRSTSSHGDPDLKMGREPSVSADEDAIDDTVSAGNLSGTSTDELDKVVGDAIMPDAPGEDASDQEADIQEDTIAIETVPDSREELDFGPERDGEEEEAADSAARNEDETAKKKMAMNSLKPIEKLFAVFRDRLFDERLALLSSELEFLNQESPTHAEFLAMRQCIDARRDEKIHLEQVALAYKLKALENKCVAERAQLHSQYLQTVREVRDKRIEGLYEQQCQVKRELRQWNKQETDFSYKFNPKRSLQIIQQRAYNAEVSLLSGIARYNGFPAAPEIEGIRPSDIEEDFRKMKVKPQPTSYIAQVANTRAATAAAEEQFLEKTPWANPNHPAHQQAVILERQAFVQQPRTFTSYTTPAAQGWMMDVHKVPSGSSSTIPIPSNPPSSVFSNATIPSRPPMHGAGQVVDSSPIDRRRASFANGNSIRTPPRDDTAIQETPVPEASDKLPTINKPISRTLYDPSVPHQIPPMSGGRLGRSPDAFENPSIMSRPGQFGKIFGETQGSLTSGEGLPVKHEDEHERYPFAAIPGRESHFGPRGLPAGVTVERYGVR